MTLTSSASLHDLAGRLSKRYDTLLPPQYIFLLGDVPLVSLEELNEVVESLGLGDNSSPKRKLELKIDHLLVELDAISLGLRMEYTRASKASSFLAELHRALFPRVPPPPPSSQIFRLDLFSTHSSDEQLRTDSHLYEGCRRLDTLDVWLGLRKEGLIRNTAGGLEIAGVSRVEVESLVLLRKNGNCTEGWKELGRLSVK